MQGWEWKGSYSTGSDWGQRGKASERGHAGMGGGEDMTRQRQKIDDTDRRRLEGVVHDEKRQALGEHKEN